jgi:hypothetical protein
MSLKLRHFGTWAVTATETSTNFDACPLTLAGLYKPTTGVASDSRVFVDAYDTALIDTGAINFIGLRGDVPITIID